MQRFVPFKLFLIKVHTVKCDGAVRGLHKSQELETKNCVLIHLMFLESPELFRQCLIRSERDPSERAVVASRVQRVRLRTSE